MVKGLVGPIVVLGVVLGSIYGGITGITEAAGMGVIAVALIALTDIFRGFLPFIAIKLCAVSLLLIWPPLVSVFL